MCFLSTNVDSTYVILNNGNVGSNTPATTPYVVTVTPNYGGTTAPAGTVVQYFNGTTKIYDSSDLTNFPGTVAVKADDPATAADEGQLTITQTVIIPATAATGTVFSVSSSRQCSGLQFGYQHQPRHRRRHRRPPVHPDHDLHAQRGCRAQR